MRFGFTLFSLLLLTACASNVKTLRDLKPEGADFTHVLASEYQAYSESESEQGRLFAAEHYAGKGVKLLKGEVVEPDMPDSSLPDAIGQESVAARGRLMKLMNDKIKKSAPQKLARAQLLFDCWQYELKKHIDQEQAPCADEFHSTMAELHTLADAALYNQTATYTLAFAAGSTKISVKNHVLIKKIAHGVIRRKQYAIDIRGHSNDGEAAARLGEARLGAVKKAFVQAGVPLVHIEGLNEDDSEKVYLSSDARPKDDDKLVVTVKTQNKSKGL